MNSGEVEDLLAAIKRISDTLKRPLPDFERAALVELRLELREQLQRVTAP